MVTRGILWIVGLAFGLAGCAMDGPVLYESSDGQSLRKIEGPGLVARARSPVGDMPMPVGFVMVESRSQTLIQGGARFVDHLYQGRTTKDEAVRYYRQQAKLHDWAPAVEQYNEGAIYLRFNKVEEDLVLQVWENNNITSVRMRITNRRVPLPPEATMPAKP